MISTGALGEHVVDYFRRRLVIYALVLSLFSLGLVVGGVALRAVGPGDRSELTSFLEGYLTQMATAVPGSQGAFGPGDAVAMGVLRGAGIPWLLGLTVIGAPLVLGLVFLRGFALGFTLAFLFEELSFKGILLALVSVAPHEIFSIPGICLAAGAAITFSLGAAKVLAGRRDEGRVYSHFVTATLLTLVASGFIAASTWVQNGVTPVLVETVTRYIQF